VTNPVSITAVICTYNRYDLLPKAIDSLLTQTLDSSSYQILIVDNTPPKQRSEGESLALSYQSAANMAYLFEDTPGLSNARNVAAKAAQSDYILYLDDDAIADQALLENIINAFEQFDNVGVVGGKILPIWEIERPCWLGDDIVGNVSVVDWGGGTRVAGSGEWFAGANISFRLSALRESGGFSTTLGRVGAGNSLMSNEEIEVLEFLKNSGYNAVYAPDAKVDHLVERKRISRDWFRRRIAWQATSDFIMDADKIEPQLPQLISSVRDYLASLPPLSRNIQGLYYKTEDPSEFRWQLSALYSFTCLTLAGFSGLENEFDE
jgi:glycosyltransferase involved in cell wall biosynthesis